MGGGGGDAVTRSTSFETVNKVKYNRNRSFHTF